MTQGPPAPPTSNLEIVISDVNRGGHLPARGAPGGDRGRRSSPVEARILQDRPAQAAPAAAQARQGQQGLQWRPWRF